MKQDVNNFFIQLSIVADTLWEDKAYVAMSKILDQFEKTSSPQECIGIDNFQQGILATIAFDLRDAKDYFNAAILEDPTNVYYWLAKYMIYLNLGLYDNCIVIAVEASLVTKKK